MFERRKKMYPDVIKPRIDLNSVIALDCRPLMLQRPRFDNVAPKTEKGSYVKAHQPWRSKYAGNENAGMSE
jgi:hypothetical protein